MLPTFGVLSTNWCDARRTNPSNATSISSITNYEDTTSLRTRLSALGFSTAQLDYMTHNDMIYALRTKDDAAGIG